MKLSELSFREYIALEALPAFAGTMLDKDAAWRAFSLADQFLKRAGREHDKIASIKRECDKLEIQNSLLLNMGEDPASRIALLQIWEFLGVKNQTEAMDRLRKLDGEGHTND
jgi:hypothetical protein